MRKIYFQLLLLTLASAALGQNYPVTRPHHFKPVPLIPVANRHPPLKADSQSTQITVDYLDAELQHYLNEGNFDYHAFNNVANFNANFASNKIGYRYVYSRVDSLYDENTGIAYQKAGVSTITVDSFTVVVNHIDSSHTLNTLYAEIVSLNSKGYPTNTVLWEDSLGTDTSLGGFTPITFRPAFTVPDNHYAYRFDFKGDTALDTFNILVGCHAPVDTQGTCSGFNFCDTLSHFYPNSYGFILENIDLVVPTSTGGFLYFDCNGNNKYDSGIDARDYLQDLYVISNITLNNVTGVRTHPDAINSLRIYPNPAQDQATISYSLLQGAKVSVMISDATGKIVKQYRPVEQASGHNAINTDLSKLEQGLYFVHLLVNGKEVSVNKLSVSRN